MARKKKATAKTATTRKAKKTTRKPPKPPGTKEIIELAAQLALEKIPEEQPTPTNAIEYADTCLAVAETLFSYTRPVLDEAE